VSGSDPQANRSSDQKSEEPNVVFRDKRRIDPTTGEVRGSGWGSNNPFAAAPDPSDPAQAGQPIAAEITADSEEFAKLAADLAERTKDLQRITAEYANYRKRVDRDRELLLNNAKASIAGELLPVLDDLELAKAHGDLNGAFKAVADRLIGVLEKAGLQGFGDQGDPFDPAHHEAVQFGTSAEVDTPTVTSVFRRGYSFKERQLRAAVVSVTGPEHDGPTDKDSNGSPAGDSTRSTGDNVTDPETPAAEEADLLDREDDAKARSEQESKTGVVPSLSEEPATTDGQPAPTEDPA
jgi:molecular chaperone GrpE